jgi:hypothetical protein
MRRAQRMLTTGVVHLDQVSPGSSFRQLDDAFLQVSQPPTRHHLAKLSFCWVLGMRSAIQSNNT